MEVSMRINNDDVLNLLWHNKDLGYGNISIIQDKLSPDIKIYSEHMGKEFVKDVLCQMVDDAFLVE